MSSRTQKVGIPVLAMFGLLFVLLAPGAAPAAAQDDPNDESVTLIWVVDEWDGEVMTGRSTEAPPEGEGEGEDEGEGDSAVDEWDGEVMTGRSKTGPKVVLLVVAPTASPLLRTGEAEGSGDTDAAVDEWDGEVMTGGAVAAAAAGQCQLRVNGAARSFRVLRAVGLSGGKVLSLPQPVRRATRQQ